jgi:hypothetical protein
MLRIVSEGGLGHDTKFIDTETGDDIFKVVPVSYGATVTIGEIVTARCELEMVEIDIAVGKSEFLTTHPISKDLQPIASIQFKDGWRIEFFEDGAPRVNRSTPTGAK